MPRLPGDWQRIFVTFRCVTSTPLGSPVVPDAAGQELEDVELLRGRTRTRRVYHIASGISVSFRDDLVRAKLGIYVPVTGKNILENKDGRHEIHVSQP
jgi:hypothetical protein